MKRRLAKLALFLLFGAVVNVGVAWGFGFNRQFGRQVAYVSNNLDWWQSNAPAGFENIAETDAFVRIKALGHEIVQWPRGPMTSVSRFIVQRHRTGWPVLALESSHWYDGKTGTIIHKYSWNSSQPLGLEQGVALRPTWPGFVINTIFYAAILGLLFCAPGRVRRWQRTKRGRCPACAYPVGESATCTECGKPVPTKCVEPA